MCVTSAIYSLYVSFIHIKAVLHIALLLPTVLAKVKERSKGLGTGGIDYQHVIRKTNRASLLGTTQAQHLGPALDPIPMLWPVSGQI
jgi:hypothetical protein